MDLLREGKTSEAVIAAFVDKYGEKILMAPKPEGFNLAGYVVPGAAILAGRRHRGVDHQPAGATSPGTARRLGPDADLAGRTSGDERRASQRLERELAEMEK